MDVKLQKIATRMSKIAVYAMIICQSVLMAMANETTAQRKYLDEIFIQVNLAGGSENTVPLKVLVGEIESSSDFRFAYSHRDIKDKYIKISPGKWNLLQLMNEISSQTGFSISRVNESIGLIPTDVKETPIVKEEITVQESVSGTVTDEKGEGLPGSSVVERGTSNGTITDVEGKFSLNVSDGATLSVSFVGYESIDVPVNGRSVIDISLEANISALEEVVVVGYGTKAKGELTGSVSSIEGENIEQMSEMNIVQALQGQLPGVKVSNRGGEPGNESVEFTVRGISTLGNNSPLIIIDGVPRQSQDLARLSPNDIESMSVLKDAAAAIYGARAANGVINIVTKRGQQGGNKIRLISNYGISSFTRVSELMDSYQWATYNNEVEERYGRQPLFTDQQLQKYQEGGELPLYPNTDFYEEVFRDWAPEMHHNLSSSGGGENIRYFISGDYLQQEGLYKSKDMKYEQYQIRSNIDGQISRSLSVGLDLAVRLEKSHRPSWSTSGLFSAVQRAMPIEVAYFDNGLPGPAGEQGTNPVILSSDKAGWNNANNKIFQSKISFNYDMEQLIQGLELTGYASYDFRVDNDEFFRTIWTYYTYDVNNDEYVPQVGYDWQRGATRRLRLTENRRQNIFYHLRLNYSKSFNDHNIDAFVAYEQQEGLTNLLQAYREGLISDKKVHLWAGSTNGMDTDSNAEGLGRQNYFGSFSYNYRGKYLLDFTLRHDGSSVFAKDHQFGTFPGISVGWNVAEESFMNGTNNWLDNLKLRGSWAIMGNDRIPGFQYLNQFELDSYYILGESPRRVEGFENINTPNPIITWEESNMMNFGLDAILWGGALSASLDYFFEKRRQILITRNASVPDYAALQLPDENLGKVDNRGVEVVLNHVGKLGGLAYSIGGNLTYNKSKIVFLDEPLDVSPFRKQEGFPIESFVVYKTDGIYRTEEEINNSPHLNGTLPGDIKYVDIDGDDEITSNDRYRRYTSPIPEIQYGINLGLSFKGFEMTAFFQGQARAENLILFDDLGNRPAFQFTERWTDGSMNSELPRAMERNDTYNARDSDFWLYDASFLRLRNLMLAYNLPSSVLQKTGIGNLQLFFKGSNLFTLDKIKFMDPEGDNSQGRYYPQLTRLQLGLEIGL